VAFPRFAARPGRHYQPLVVGPLGAVALAVLDVLDEENERALNTRVLAVAVL
jgi:hypothetical protein